VKLLLGTIFLGSACLSWSQNLNYVESNDGDLSDNFNVPTILPVGLGDNFLQGTLTGGTNDLDLFRIVVPAGLEIFEIRLVEASGGGAGSFLLIQPGDNLSSRPANNFSDPIGFSILASGAIGDDILPTLTLPGVVSLPPFFGQGTLTEGSYAGWLNETGAASTYTLNFRTQAVAIPEASTSLFCLTAMSFLCWRRRK